MRRINAIVEKFIIETEIESMDEFTFLNRLIDIFDRNMKSIYIPNYHHKVPFKRSFGYSYEFLKAVNPEYATYLEKRMEEGAFVLDKSRENRDNNAMSGIIDGTPKIYLPVQNTIEDTYSITHEIIHDMSLDEKNLSETRTIFCEIFSLFMEELERKYFASTVKPCEYAINSLKNLAAISEKNQIIRFEQSLISTYLDQQQTSLIDLNYNKNSNFMMSVIQDIMKEQELSFDIEQRYVIGYLFACYMLDRVEQNPKNLQEFFELNEMINKYYVEDLLDYLELECKDQPIFDLTEKSYQKLEKAYVKHLKKIG